MKKLALIHTVDWFHMSVVNPFAKPWLEKNPGVEIQNICDDRLLKDCLVLGHMPPNVAKRVVQYAQCAEASGADAVMITCTTVNEAAKLARKLVNIPVFNIDEPMAKQAVALGRRIGIVATVPTSAPATERLLQEAAAEQGKEIEIHTVIREEAFQALLAGDRGRHDTLVHAEMDELAKKVDVIALGQISLSQIRHDCGVPVLQVGESGFQEATRILFGDKAS